ncbi:motility protein A [Sphingomonas japonica]|uniref:Chemotaxis protein MotA n=1 Tax=Sphingomonas japonica TaxID=511662 RepID=A0ABX0U2R5_9SPHN|nr:MotA/TolQ/ExbB proton channel family protein [Sphingomonas japonica]NIJ23991.1 chemotaxis protein MotA [Sphingomonas japonica]
MSIALPSELTAFFDPVALAIVGGGTLIALVLRTPLGLLLRAFAAVRLVLRRGYDADPHLQQIAALGRIARRSGVIALDRSVITDPDIAAAIDAIVDGSPPETVARTLTECRDARIERHLAVADTWSAAADIAPTMGMIGTLIGLARMFQSMTDPEAIGPAMAIALLATLYGALVAALIAAPVAARLRRLARAEAFERARLEAPLVALADRERPRLREVAAA